MQLKLPIYSLQVESVWFADIREKICRQGLILLTPVCTNQHWYLVAVKEGALEIYNSVSGDIEDYKALLYPLQLIAFYDG